MGKKGGSSPKTTPNGGFETEEKGIEMTKQRGSQSKNR